MRLQLNHRQPQSDSDSDSDDHDLHYNHQNFDFNNSSTFLSTRQNVARHQSTTATYGYIARLAWTVYDPHNTNPEKRFKGI